LLVKNRGLKNTGILLELVFETQEYKTNFIPLVNKDLLIPPFTCRKFFEQLEMDVLFPPFYEGKQAFS